MSEQTAIRAITPDISAMNLAELRAMESLLAAVIPAAAILAKAKVLSEPDVTISLQDGVASAFLTVSTDVVDWTPDPQAEGEGS